MPLVRAFAVVLVLVLSAFPALAAEKETAYDRVIRTGTIRCGYITLAPYNFLKDPNDPNSRTGIVFDLMQQLGEILDLKIEWTEEVGWGTIGAGFKTGRYDMACISMWPDAAKYKNFLLSIPLYYSAIYPWVRADDTRFDGHPEKIDSADVRIAAIDGAFSYNLAKSSFPKAQIVAVSPEAQIAEYYMTVTSRKADILNSDYDEIAPFLEKNPGLLRKVDNVPPLSIYPQVLAVNAGEYQMQSMINSALQFLVDNGALEKLQKKYGTHYLVRQFSYNAPEQKQKP